MKKQPTIDQIRKSLTGLHGIRINDSRIFEELQSVDVIINTKSGNQFSLSLDSKEMFERFWIMQTISNCVGFPIAAEIDVAVIHSVIQNPIGPLKEWFAGNEKIIEFFSSTSRYKSVYWEINNDKEVLRVPISYKENIFFEGSKSKIDLEIEILNWLCKTEKTKIEK